SSRGFSGDGKQFILASDNIIRTFDVASGQPVHTLRGHVSQVMAIFATPDGKLLRSVESGTLKEWDIRPPEDRLVGVREGWRGRDYAVSANGAFVATFEPRDNGKSDVVQVWKVAGNGTRILPARPREVEVARDISPQVLLSADGK